MKFDLEQVSFLVAILMAIVGGTWRISQQKVEILKIIDTDMKAINLSLQEIKYNLGVHITEYKHKEELTQFKMTTIEDNLVSSFKRCQQQIKDIQGFLKRDTGYAVRDSTDIE